MEKRNDVVTLAVVDDHSLFRKGLINLIQSFGLRYKVIAEAGNGREFLVSLNNSTLPDIVILDINMPQMDGFETVNKLREVYKDVRILVITMVEEEQTLIKMLKAGVRGYLGKDVEPDVLKEAIDTILSKGYYYTDHLTGKLIHALNSTTPEKSIGVEINERESKFLQLACSEYTYKEIADIMCLSPKTVDGYRNALFEKLNVKSRVGLVLYAIKNDLFTI